MGNSHGTVSTATPLPTLDEFQDVAIGVCSHSADSLPGGAASVAISNYLISMALSSLTGVRAFVPIFVVGVWGKVDPEGFPLCLSDSGTWLTSWLTIVFIGLLLLVEIVADCIPLVDEFSDCIMDVVKPIVSIALAIAPHYNGSMVMTVFVALNAGVVSEVIALGKQAETALVDATTMGAGAPVRSCIEDVIVIVGTVSSLAFAWMAGLVFIVSLCIACFFIYRFCMWRRRRRREKAQAAELALAQGRPDEAQIIMEMEDYYDSRDNQSPFESESDDDEKGCCCR